MVKIKRKVPIRKRMSIITDADYSRTRHSQRDEQVVEVKVMCENGSVFFDFSDRTQVRIYPGDSFVIKLRDAELRILFPRKED